MPVHVPFTLAIKSPSVEPGLYSKLLLVTRNEDHELEAAGGDYRDGAVVASLRNFGEFAIALDTIAPKIISLDRSASDYTGKKELRFTISDELSGIDTYEGYIDNHWALFEYDPKNDLLLYRFDEKYIKERFDP